jgi:signal transduction histidine kinase
MPTIDDVILYVDDDTSNLVVLQAACADTFRVEIVSNGPAALEVMAHSEVAVLLADQRMPGMTGIELCEMTAERHPDTVRMLITAYADMSETVQAINRGKVSRYVRKPWDPAELKAVLRDSVDVYKTRMRLRHLERRFIETERTYALGVIAAGFAHEVRSPLASLVMNNDLARTRLGELQAALEPLGGVTPLHWELIEKIGRHVAAADQSAERLREITEGIDLSHRRTDTQITTDMHQILDLTLKLVRSTISRRAILETQVEPVPYVFGSPSKLGQVLTNLLINAVQAMPERPRAENLITIDLRAMDGSVELAISDNGIGMSAETLERIFDPFFTTKSEGGTGLGLAISKTIVEEAGGRIEVSSEEGQGSRFTVWLPVARGRART